MKIKGGKLKRALAGLAAVSVLISAPTQSLGAELWREYSDYIPVETPVQKRELRGAWISSVLNLDWPSSTTRDIENDSERIAKSKAELVAMLDKAEDMNMNAVFFQVSPEGDALYKSDIVPWSRYLTGTYGKDPGFDPLKFAVEEAHKRNLELHAWLNPYRVAMKDDDATKGTLDVEKSVYRDHGDWIREASGKLIVDPGLPGARDWVSSRVMEVVKNYDVDGIHFDDYFYLAGVDDDATFATYNSGGFSDKGDWRRENTYLLVKDISQKIKAEKPWVKFGISPSGVWANKSDGYPDGSDTKAGLTHYDKSFADTKKWIEEEIIDYIAPQVYWSFENKAAPYGEIATWWSDVVSGKDVHLYMGQALYKVNSDSDTSFNGAEAVKEFNRQLKFNMAKPEVSGSILFRFRNIYDAGKQDVVKSIEKDTWSKKALVPAMPWKGGATPSAPESGTVEKSDRGVKVSWKDADPNTSYYAIYRVDKNIGIDTSQNSSGRYLVGTVRKQEGLAQEYVDEGNYDDNTVYAVTALDRLHNESASALVGRNSSKYFYDVGSGVSEWAIEAIDSLYEKKVVKGIGGGLFTPGNSVRRADFIIMVMNGYGIDIEVGLGDNFSDAGDSYYTDYLGTAKKLGIVKGVGDNKFHPLDSISRQDMFTILYRALDSIGELPTVEEPSKRLEDFCDSGDIPSYAYDAIKLFVESGVVRGDEGYIRPGDTSNRDQAAQVMYNLISK